jgi:hypothetical protein
MTRLVFAKVVVFGGAEVRNITSRLRRLQRQGYSFTTNASPTDLVERLRGFHAAFAEQCAKAPVTEEQIKTPDRRVTRRLPRPHVECECLP